MPSWRTAARERARVGEKLVRVECYAGHKGDERPVRVEIGRQMTEVSAVEDRWYSPGATYFRVLLVTGERYVLRRDDAQDVWALEAFRAPQRFVDTKNKRSV
jgi:hypothetical protein